MQSSWSVYARGALCLSVLGACKAPEQDCIVGTQVWEAQTSDVACVLGDLLVEGRRTEDLAILAQVEYIEGALVIHDNPSLREFPELPTLTHIGGAFSLSENPELEVVYGFPALERIDGRVYVGENQKLSQFALGDRLASVGAVFVALNPALEDFTAPVALARIEGDVNVSMNSGLRRIEFPGLTDVEDGLYLEDNAILAGLDFPVLRTIGSDWSIAGNRALASLDGFSALERVGRQIDISGNDALEVFSMAASIDTPSLSISGNAALRKIVGLDPIRIGGDANVTIRDNSELQTIEGFVGVDVLSGLTIEENASLLEIDGLRSLVRVEPYVLGILRNGSLTGPENLLPSLSEVSELWVFGNKSLSPSIVQSLLKHVSVDGAIRVGDNEGEETALDPCPWAGDGLCDAITPSGARYTQLCAIDPEDCL